ncbi:AAA domain-containing protein [Halorhabdus rudnickae]|uniref:AAA domain-containing protein n=1 Tax=Halorhabdus rudnickae TaxID=1775544 RepID=UPI00108251C8|nr:AAA domain-containing protein [Halorhabdus rudnickae]
MSLLFDHVISDFDPDPEDHYTIIEGDLESTGERIPVKPIIDFAGQRGLTHPNPDDDYVCIPLHGENRAKLTGEFLAYGDTNIHGEVIIYLEDGDREAIEIDEFAQTRLARRIRFWHSDYQPAEFPPSFDRPVNDREPPSRRIDPEEFVEDLETHVVDERDATREGNRKQAQTSTPREIFEANGDAIPALEYLDDQGQTIRFKAQALDRDWHSDRENWAYYVPSTFGIYQGNEVLIHGPTDTFPISATVANIRGLDLEVKVQWVDVDSPSQVRSTLMNGGEIGMSALLNPVPTERELGAIDDLRHDPMLEVLTGQRPLTFSHAAASNSETLDPELNQEQEIAAELAMLADDVFCIHGPPGTGKTRTLIEIIRRAVDAGERVLVCADSNQAVDNIVVGDSTPDSPDESSLHSYAQHGAEELTLYRPRGGQHSSSDLVEQYSDFEGLADVVATTNNGAAEVAGTFDLVVHDEATQATVPSSCIPLTKGDRIVLAGDHKQLPPFRSTESPPDSELGMSLFEHLYASGGIYEGVGMQLKTQYRMHRDIAAFSNREFYDKELRSGRTVDLLSSRDEAIEAFNIGGSVAVDEHSRSNENEAKMVTHLVTDLLDDLPPGDVGVITPYRAQVREIRSMLEDHVSDDMPTVDTIDSFQGSEREAIILSLVRSNSEGKLGFLSRDPDGPRRLNVALTRAKRYCAVVADLHTFQYTDSEDTPGPIRSFPDHFQDTSRVRDVDPAFLSV